MAQQPHDKAGQKCNRCPKIFTSQSITLTLHKREGNILINEMVCVPCHNAHFSKGE